MRARKGTAWREVRKFIIGPSSEHLHFLFCRTNTSYLVCFVLWCSGLVNLNCMSDGLSAPMSRLCAGGRLRLLFTVINYYNGPIIIFQKSKTNLCAAAVDRTVLFGRCCRTVNTVSLAWMTTILPPPSPTTVATR